MGTRSEEQRELDYARISDMYLRGWSCRRIGEAIGISHVSVSTELKIIRQRWLEEQVKNFDELQQRELLRLDKVECEMWDAWEKSKADQITSTARREDGMIAKTVNEVRKAQQTGEAQYMQVIMRCIEKRCKILGLDAPEKVQHSGSLDVTALIGLLQEDAAPAEPAAEATA
jgi:hypothetical protein